MKKLLITVCLSGLLSVPSAVLGAEMAGPSLYGSFRTGLEFGSGDASVEDFTSRWGFKGSHEVSEGLTASYKYESKFNTTTAESSGGVGHKHAGAAASTDYDFNHKASSDMVADPDDPEAMIPRTTTAYDPGQHTLDEDEDGNVKIDENGHGTQTSRDENGMVTETLYFQVEDSHSSNAQAKTDADGGPGGRLSYVSLSGGFGTITLGQIWSASAIHYGFKVDPSYVNGVFGGVDFTGGANYRNARTVSYSSSAGDVSFQIDKTTGDKPKDKKLEFGASATLGPVGVGFGHWSSDDDAGFTGVAVSTGAAGVNLTVGLGSSKLADGTKTKTNILHVGGSVGDTGLSYALQVATSSEDAGDQNLLVVTNSLGSGASLIFEHLSPGDSDSSSLIGLKVDF